MSISSSEIDDRRRRARLARDADEVVQDRLARQLLDDPGARAAALEPRRDHRNAQPLERARDVDPLAAGLGEPLARAVPLAALEVRDGQRPVDRCVQGDGHDHVTQLQASWAALPAYQAARPKVS